MIGRPLTTVTFGIFVFFVSFVSFVFFVFFVIPELRRMSWHSSFAPQRRSR